MSPSRLIRPRLLAPVAVVVLSFGAAVARVEPAPPLARRLAACAKEAAGQRAHFREAINTLRAGHLRAGGWEVTLGTQLGQGLGGGLSLGLGRVRDSHGRCQWRLFRATPTVDVNATQVIPLSLGIHLRRGTAPGQRARDLDGGEVKLGGGACAFMGGRAYVGRGASHQVLSLHADVGAGQAAGIQLSRPITMLGAKRRPGRLARRLLKGYRLAGAIQRSLAEAGRAPPKEARALLDRSSDKLSRLKRLQRSTDRALRKRLLPRSQRQASKNKEKARPRGLLGRLAASSAKPLGALALAGVCLLNNAPLVTGGADPTPLHAQVVERVIERPTAQQRELLARDPRLVLGEKQRRAVEAAIVNGAKLREQPLVLSLARVFGEASNSGSRAFLTQRAARYDTTNSAVAALRHQRAIGTMYSALDSAGLIYFKNDLKSLMKNPDVLRFLTELNQQLARPGRRVDLFQLARKHSRDPAEATRWLAVLFQDTHRGPVFPPGSMLRDAGARRLLETVAYQLTHADPAAVTRYPGGWYPEQRNSHHDDELYHYWVIRHIAGQLRRRGHRAADAFLAPFLLNTEYELASYVPKPGMVRITPSVAAGAVREIWRGPAPSLEKAGLDPVQHEHHLRHMYMGYRGAMDGAGVKAAPMSYESFRAMMNRDHVAGIRHMLSQAQGSTAD